MITPFLALVIAGFVLFMTVLGAIWVRDFSADLRASRTQSR